MRMTARQIALYYREAMLHESNSMARAITAASLGAAAAQSKQGAQAARAAVRRLTES
jgi:hypothetical protein